MTSVQLHVGVRPRGATDAADRRALTAAVAYVAGTDCAVLEQRCAHCGGPHGRPVPVAPAACVPLAVSLSRAGSCVAIAVAAGSPVGVDVESILDLNRHSVDAVAFNDAEITMLHALSPAAAPHARATLWTAKEAVLKLTGQGLRVDPRELTVTLTRAGVAGVLASWTAAPFVLARLQLLPVAAGPGLVGTVAVLAETPPTQQRLDRHPFDP